MKSVRNYFILYETVFVTLNQDICWFGDAVKSLFCLWKEFKFILSFSEWIGLTYPLQLFMKLFKALDDKRMHSRMSIKTKLIGLLLLVFILVYRVIWHFYTRHRVAIPFFAEEERDRYRGSARASKKRGGSAQGFRLFEQQVW